MIDRIKFLEIRDAGTFIPMMAVNMANYTWDEGASYLLRRAGFGKDRLIWLSGIDGGFGQGSCDPYDWTNRTRQIAHKYIEEHWDELKSGDVVDVEFILGERDTIKKSERFESE